MVSDQGKINNIMVTPKKQVHLEDNHKCRKRPYVEEFTEYFLQNLFTVCQKPCKGANYMYYCNGLFLSEIVRQLPMCKMFHMDDGRELECFYDVFEMTLRNVTTKPCTLLQYKVRNYQEDFQMGYDARLTSFAIAFDSPHVSVKEEYLIYDMVAMVSAIGGTLGLFVGFSFSEMASSILKRTQVFIARFKENKRKVDPTLVKTKEEKVRLSHDEMAKSISALEARMSTYEKEFIKCRKPIITHNKT